MTISSGTKILILRVIFFSCLLIGFFLAPVWVLLLGTAALVYVEIDGAEQDALRELRHKIEKLNGEVSEAELAMRRANHGLDSY